MSAVSLDDYRYRGAGALIELHERHLRSFLDVWREARDRGLTLPETADPDCASLVALRRHVLRAARGYLRWCCEVLDLSDPEIPPTPSIEEDDGAMTIHRSRMFQLWQ